MYVLCDIVIVVVILLLILLLYYCDRDFALLYQVHPIYHYGRKLIAEELLTGDEIQIEFGILNGSTVFYAFR